MSVVIGGSPTATGGTAPYNYSWAPGGSLNNTTSSNPVATPLTNTIYTVFVTDAAGNTGSATVTILLHAQSIASAGPNHDLCVGDSVTLGGTNIPGGGTVFSWAPNIDISSNSAPNPVAWPIQTTTYTLTVTGPNCTINVSTVTITVHPLPVISAGPDVTILSGQSITLNASGATQYYWSPNTWMNYSNIPNPDVDPANTITYYLLAVDGNGCTAYDNVTITVIESDSLFIYNTFTPNNDGDNDSWFIGNIYSYPDNTLTIFNRNGRVVYSAHPYENNFHGKNQGDELPCGTYYYILDTGKNNKVLHGSVTILR